ncbi:MAG: two-component regulator propeller domain-containing protein, partial [bacterium]
MKDCFRLFVVAAGLLVSTNTQAQTWDLLARANGLPSDSILDISSRNDTTYVLHPRAISRFTGLWQYFPETFGAEADAERNNVIYFDPQGGLWIGRTNGIYFVSSASLNSPNPKAQNRTKTFFPDADSISPVVTAIYRDRNQVLWIGTLNRGLLRFGSGTGCRSIKPITGSAFFAKRLKSIPEVTDIVEDSSSLWIGTFDGLIHINSCGDSLGAFLGGRWVRHLLVDKHRRVWAATDRGLYVATDPTLPKYELVWTRSNCEDTTRARLPMPAMTAVMQDFSGAIWATSDTNVYRYQELDSP